MGSREEDSTTFVAKTPTALRILPFVVMVPALVVIVAVPVWPVILVDVVVLVLLVWMVFGARISVVVGPETVEISAPFYRRSIPVGEIVGATLHRRDGADESLLNWPVVGRATSAVGVRLSMGGTLGPRIVTTAGEKYTVFLSSTAEAETCTGAISAVLDGGRLSPRPGA
jgi:hypothetical protein